MYQLSAWQVKELAKAWLRGVTCVHDLDDNQFNTILSDQNTRTVIRKPQKFQELVEELFDEFLDVEEGGW